MKFLKKFNEMNLSSESDIPRDSIYSDATIDQPKVRVNKNLIYNSHWKAELPEFLSINNNKKEYKYKRGNVMLLADTVQITYDLYPEEKWGIPDTLEFDIYFVKDSESQKIRIDVDVTYGDLMACEFSIDPPNKVNVTQDTTYHSKFDPSNSVFALTDESLNKFIEFLNKIDGIKVTRNDMKFLDQYDNWTNKKA